MFWMSVSLTETLEAYLAEVYLYLRDKDIWVAFEDMTDSCLKQFGLIILNEQIST